MKKILILGGTSFQGRQLVRLLSSSKDQYEVFTVHRGKNYWNSEFKLMKQVTRQYGDRDQYDDFTKLLTYLTTKHAITSQSPWHAVIDFCAFKPKHVRSVVQAITGKVRLYVFVSSDSVYEVSDPRNLKQPVTENCAVRPEGERRARELAEQDQYGHKKLLSEQYLYQTKSEAFPFMILRLADVFGPYDNSGRFWAYVKWMMLHQTHPFQVTEKELTKHLSFVFSKDVTALIKRLVDQADLKGQLYESYNLAFPQGIPIDKLLRMIAKKLGIEKLDIRVCKDSSKNFYPSVFCGWLDTSKAVEKLGWTCTDMEAAVHQTVRFFRRAEGEYMKEEEAALKMVRKKLRL